jgi:simple sugar transport system substrate-binding protein
MSVFIVSGMIMALPQPANAGNPFTFGMLLVGPANDHGWSQAHFDAGKYVEKKIPGTRMIYIDKVNPADRPGVTIPQLVNDMIGKGATLIIANSDDMSDGITEAAAQHPNVNFIHVSGDGALTGKAPKNLSNIMGRVEYPKMIAGFAAAMMTKTGKIAYLGPLVNDETRRLAVSCYLGAKYAWEKVLKRNPADLRFDTAFIGFWFNIPGVTSDPSQVTGTFIDSGVDVVISGIDTPEACVVARQKHQAGKRVFAIPYDYKNACAGADDVCLGVPYFNWGPAYVDYIRKAMKGPVKQFWQWNGPDYKNINNPDTSAVGFVKGPALSSDASKQLDLFIKGLGTGKINLFKGPLFYQDGSVYLKSGETANDHQIWYMKQMLKGMTGTAKK